MKRARLSLDLDPKVKRNFEELCTRTGTSTLTDLIKKSVALYHIAADHTTHGGSLIFRHKDGREERIIVL